MEENPEALLGKLEQRWRKSLADFIQSKVRTPLMPHDLALGEEVKAVGPYPYLIASDDLRRMPSFTLHKLGGIYTPNLIADARVDFKISGGDKPLGKDNYRGAKRFLKAVIGEIYEPPSDRHHINHPYFEMIVVYAAEPPYGCRPITHNNLGLKFSEDGKEAKLLQYILGADGTRSKGSYPVSNQAKFIDFESFHSLIGLISPSTKPSSI